MKYELDKQTIDILSNFLGRVQLQGNEVNAFNKIVNVLQNPIKEVEEKKDEKRK